MPKTKTKKQTAKQEQSLEERIGASMVFDQEQKNLLLQMLPGLSDEQKKSIEDFLDKESKTFSEAEEKYLAERSKIYQEYLKKLDQSLKEAKKMVTREAEKKEAEHAGDTEQILKEIDNL